MTEVEHTLHSVSPVAGAKRKIERGIIALPEEQQEAIKAVLIDHGALFLPDSNAGGYGVRLKFPSEKTRQIDRWEGEGGQAGEDDV